MTLQQYLKEHYSPAVTKDYKRLIDHYLSFLKGTAMTATYQDVLDYIGYLRKAGKHPKTVRSNLYAIKTYYRYLLAAGLREDHPCQYLYLKDKVNRAIAIEHLYTSEQLEELLSNYHYGPWKHHSPKREQIEHRNKVILSLLIYQALTTLEITQLELANVDLERAEVFIKSNINNKARTLPLKGSQILLLHHYIHQTRPQLSPKTSALLVNYKGESLGSTSIIRSINQPGKEYVSPGRISPFKIRQSVLAHLLKQGNDLRIVQVFAGHRNSASTEAYRQSGLDELKAAISQLHPLG